MSLPIEPPFATMEALLVPEISADGARQCEPKWDGLRSGLSSERFRHGTRFVRFRPDKASTQCRMDQIAARGAGPLAVMR